ncbi:MAG: patatin-like phospholipase family protein, partial [Chloroflexi bacterium]|nr:patatin-like phospholipase family protein [Chloroflexota bacterium]
AIRDTLELDRPDIAAARADFAAVVAAAEPVTSPDRDGATPSELELAIEGEVRLLAVDKGATVCRQGEPADALYVLLSGRLGELAAGEDGAERLLAEIATGETAGETELLTGDARPATIRAHRDSTLLALEYSACHRLIERYPAFLMALTSVVIRRFREVQAAGPRHRSSELRTLAVLPLSPDVPAHAFAERLAHELGAEGETRHLTRDAAEAGLGEAGDALVADTYDDRLVGWVNEQEARSRFVVYEADPELNAWTNRCLRQADRVLLLAYGRDQPLACPLLRQLLAEGVLLENVDLGLLHGETAAHAAGTAEWLRQVNPRDYYQLRLGRDDDLRYLVRRLLGRAVGVVMGGGGARAFASIGAIQAIHEAGLPIDMVGGTSAGAFVAAMFAAGWDQARMMTIIRETLANPRKNNDYTLPLVSLTSARNLTAQVKRLFGDTQIEDLWRPFFCISSNLTRAEMMVHRSGLLWRHVRASCSVPTLLPPVLEDGDLLVDGMLLNNLPVDVMNDVARGGPVIAIDVSAKEDAAGNYRFDESLSGFQALLGKLRPGGVRAPSILHVVLRTIEVGSIYARKAQAQHATLYVAPPVTEFSISATHALDPIVQRGYESTKARLTEWLAQSPEARALRVRRTAAS